MQHAVMQALEPRLLFSVVYSEHNFTSSPPSTVVWTGDSVTSLPGSPSEYFLKFTGSGSLALSKLPDHYGITVSFDLYLIGDVNPGETLSGSYLYPHGSGGPDFTLTAPDSSLEADFAAAWDTLSPPSDIRYGLGTPTLTSTTGTVSQSTGVTLGYDLYGRDMYDPESGYEHGLNSSTPWASVSTGQSAVFHVTMSFDNRDPNLKLDFGAGSAVFGIDNVTVSALTAAHCTNCDANNGIPNPDAPSAGLGGMRYGALTDIGPGDSMNNGWWTGGARLWQTPEQNIVAYDMDSQIHYFTKSGSTYTPDDSADQNWTITNTGGELIMKDAQGNKTVFGDFSSGSLAGRFKYFQFANRDPSLAGDVYGSDSVDDGDTLYVPTGGYDSNGRILTLEQTTTVAAQTIIEQTQYSYNSTTSRLDGVTHRRSSDGGTSWETLDSVSYGYNSTTGALDSANYSAGGRSDAYYYRYYGTGEANGYPGGLKFAFGPDALARLEAAKGSSLGSLSDSDLLPYADGYYEYETSSNFPIAISQFNGSGSSVAGEVTVNNDPDYVPGYNNWARKIETTQADGGDTIEYQNYLNQTLLSVELAGTTVKNLTYSRYGTSGGEAGKVVLTAATSAFALYGGKYYDDTELDLSLGGSDSPYLSNTTGLFQIYHYGSTSTIDSSSDGATGDVFGSLKSQGIRQGESTSGTEIPQEAFTYVKITDGVFEIATDTQYAEEGSGSARTTSYSYTYDGARLLSIETSLPAVSSGNNGSGSADVSTTVYDDFGRPEWTRDAGGFLSYMHYDLATGALVKMIQDVNTSNTGDFADLPTGWTTPSGGGLHLITTYEVDTYGRTTKMVDPGGNITYTVYNDSAREVRTYPGWTGSNTTGPIQITRMYYPAAGAASGQQTAYTETLTLAATPTVSGGKPTGAESITAANLVSLTRNLLNDAGQVVETDAYFSFSGLTYGAEHAILQTSGGSPVDATASNDSSTGSYHKSVYGYDSAGRQNYVMAPTGTITRTVYDQLGRVLSTWVGTDDTDATESDPTGASATGNNMVKVDESQYDGGGMGDGNLTQETQYPGGSAPDRVSQYYYDWRDRLVATKPAVESSEATSDNTHFITYSDLDNLGEVTGTSVYDGDNVSISSTSGVPDKPSSSLLRSYSTTAYDEQGRAFHTTTYSIDPSDGSYQTASSYTILSNTWFDARGDAIETHTSGGPTNKMAYDGAGRITSSYTTDGGGDAAPGASGNWTDAGNVTGDFVLEQADYQYDSNGNVILTTLHQRNPDTSTGSLSANNSRTSYSTDYYDAGNRVIAAVDVGTNGGSAYTRPSTAPSASTDTLLLTLYGYNSAGEMESVTDPMGIVSKTFYDALGRQTKTVANYVDGTPSDADDQTTLYTYDGDNHVITLTADMPSGQNDQTTGYVYGVTSSGGNAIDSNDLLQLVKYPDKSTGAASSSASDQNSFTYNALGQVATKTDQNGTVHTYSYDAMGRMTSDAVTVASGNPQNVDTSILRIETSYYTQGLTYQVTSYDAASAGNVVNQVQYDYNGLGQVTQESQSHNGNVTISTPSVQYGFNTTALDANGSRPTSLTYPNGRQIGYLYTDAGDTSGLDDRISRISAISSSTSSRGSNDTNVIAGYTYLGANSVVRRDTPSSNVRLDLWGGSGSTYTGLDQFGRVTQQEWLNPGTSADILNTAYGYDRDSNRIYAQDLVNGSQSNAYSYDGLNRLTVDQKGLLTSSKDDTSSGFFQNDQSWSLDAQGNPTTTGSDESSSLVQATYNSQNQLVTRSVKGNVANTGFTDDFSSDTSANWTKIGSGDAFTVDSVGDPGYLDMTSVSQDTIGGQAEDEARNVVLLTGTVGEINALTSDFNVPSGTTSGQVGIVFGYQSAADYWIYVLDFGDNYQKVYHVENGSKGSPVCSSIDYTSGTTRNLKVLMVGNAIASPMWTAIPGGMPSGQIGLYSSVTSGPTRFNNVSFWNNDAHTDVTARWESYMPDTGNAGIDMIDPTTDSLKLGRDWGSLLSSQTIVLKNLRLDRFQATFSAQFNLGSLNFLFDNQDQRGFNSISLQGDNSIVGIYAYSQGNPLTPSSETTTITNISAGDIVWMRVECDGTNVTLKRIKSSTAPSETDWTNATDTHTWNNFNLPGGMFGFADGFGTTSVDNLTIKSDPDNNGTFDTTELVDTFTLDSSGYDSGSNPAYDNNGNMTYDGTQAYTYDAWNRLVKVAHAYRDSNGDVQKGSTFDTMAYDGLGRRISQSVTGEGSANDLTTHYYYSTGNQILEERNGSDQTLKQQVWGVQYVDELVQEGINSNPSVDQTADTTYTVLQDANFNVAGIVNSNGTLVERYQYDAYGARTAYVSGGSNDAGLNVSSSENTRVVIGGVAQPYGIMDFGSQGLLQDDSTGLIYNRARFRSTELDRFISEEPSGATLYIDGTNLYQAIGSNPITDEDPAGTTKYVFAFEGLGGYSQSTWDAYNQPGPHLVSALDAHLLRHFLSKLTGVTPGDSSGDGHKTIQVGSKATVISYYSYEDIAAAKQFAEAQGIGTKKQVNGKCYYDTVVVVGHSFGANTAWEFAGQLMTSSQKPIANLGITFDIRWPGKFGGNDWNPDWNLPMPANEWWNYWEKNFTLAVIPLYLGGNELPAPVNNRKENGNHFSIVSNASGDAIGHLNSVGYARRSVDGNDYITL
jgi:RHS repeat-associated protein